MSKRQDRKKLRLSLRDIDQTNRYYGIGCFLYGLIIYGLCLKFANLEAEQSPLLIYFHTFWISLIVSGLIFTLAFRIKKVANQLKISSESFLTVFLGSIFLAIPNYFFVFALNELLVPDNSFKEARVIMCVEEKGKHSYCHCEVEAETEKVYLKMSDDFCSVSQRAVSLRLGRLGFYSVQRKK